MATDIFGREVGEMLIMDASEAEITVSGVGSTGFVMNASISYSQNVTPVATFGKDVLMAKQPPQGTFQFGAVAGNLALAKGLAESTCVGKSISVKFKSDTCKTSGRVTSQALRAIIEADDSSFTMNGAMLAQFSIQGAATDAFFTNNIGGMFHYLST